MTGASGKPLWLSFSLRTGGGHASNGAPLVKLPSGESVAEAVAAARRAGASALLFNCCAPELMRAALAAASAALAADRSPPPHAGGVHLRLGAVRARE